jgi:hypothetical protein
MKINIMFRGKRDVAIKMKMNKMFRGKRNVAIKMKMNKCSGEREMLPSK